MGLSTLNSMAFGLAVYASQGGLPHHHARLASGRWSGATGRAFHPQGSDERFQSCFLHLILLSQALLGAMGATDARWLDVVVPKNRSFQTGRADFPHLMW